MDKPGLCDLCGSGEWRMIIDSTSGCALRSDRVVVPVALQKAECARCGLVRDGGGFEAAAGAVYEMDYRLTLGEHVFYTPAGPVPRSAAFCDWIVRLLGPDRLSGMTRALEVGAGPGLLTAALAARAPWMDVSGIELGAEAVAEAETRGRRVRRARPEEVEPASFDLVYSIAVLEHVPSPTAYLRALRRLLRPGGWLVLAQPTQEVPSYDVFFVDHLRHFAAAHLTAYAAKCGYEETAREIGHPLMPNFSMHVLYAAPPAASWAWRGAPAATTCAATARRIAADMAAVGALVQRLAAAERPIGVFGVHEVFALARAYSALGAASIACGLDDDPGRPECRSHPFPVVTPESCGGFGVSDVLLTMNKLYYPQASARLARAGVRTYPVLS